MTYKEMCEQISEYWSTHGHHKTWQEIWNYSPTGELFMVHVWYEEAKHWKDSQNMKNE